MQVVQWGDMYDVEQFVVGYGVYVDWYVVVVVCCVFYGDQCFWLLVWSVVIDCEGEVYGMQVCEFDEQGEVVVQCVVWLLELVCVIVDFCIEFESCDCEEFVCFVCCVDYVDVD